jgi:hypothetical protein
VGAIASSDINIILFGGGVVIDGDIEIEDAIC